MAKSFEATDKSGKVHKRTSQNRVYTHAVIRTWSDGYAKASWAGNRALAQKEAGASTGATSVEIVEAREVVKIIGFGRYLNQP